jgi:hypothetical protein
LRGLMRFFAFATGVGAGTTSAGAGTSAVAGAHPFDAFASLATGAFAFFATGTGAPTTVPAGFATAVGKAAIAVGVPTTALCIGADGIAFTTTAGTATTAAFAATSSATSPARSALRFGRRVAHIGQYLPPLLKEAHAPHSQSKAEGEEAMMGGLWALVVMVVSGVMHAGCVCAGSPCCFVRLAPISVPKNWQTTAYWGSPKSS